MVQELGRQLLGQAMAKKAHDLYILPEGEGYTVFIRSGLEKERLETLSFERALNLISHFKFVSGMNVGEKRRAQLGSCDYAYASDEQVSIRLSSVGDYKGRESLVIRFLHDGKSKLSFWEEGFSQALNMVKGRGLYLFSGPVGSGKTSLMYQLAREHFLGQQVISIEDPVEIKQEQMLQLQLNTSIGMTYDNLIKLSLRHRPDLLIIGEIRDEETARAVIRASLTGTTIFSTIHARSIKGVYARLLELGATVGELDNCLQAICYQRLLKGKGVITVAEEDYANHTSKEWNALLERLYQGGHITLSEKEAESIKD